MNIIYIDQKNATITTKQNQLFINTQQIPFKLIDTIILSGNYNLKTKDILHITQNNISILFISNNLAKSAIIHSANAKNSELKLKQYTKASTTPIDIAKYILTNKITSHNQHLKELNLKSNSTYLTKIQNANSLDELLGIEGSYSRYYFIQYFKQFPKKICKGKRSKQPPLDPLNAMLSFTYTLFYNLISIRLASFGFEPSIGFLHRPFREHYALSSDILEIYRAPINGFVKELFTSKTLTINDFTKQKGVYLKYNSRKNFWNSFNAFYQTQQSKIDNTISEIRSLL